jgi:hypothetical protein
MTVEVSKTSLGIKLAPDGGDEVPRHIATAGTVDV